MALHNYIYSKHPHDVSTDTKIAKEHEPKPKIIHLDSNISESHNNKLIDKYENEINLDSIMADDILIDDDTNNDETLNKDNENNENAEFGDIELEDSSDSDFLRQQQNTLKIHHNHHHHHNHINNKIMNLEESSLSLIKTNSATYISNSDNDSSNSLNKSHSKDSKWVIVNGKKKRLKSRFNSKHDNYSNASSSSSPTDLPLLTSKSNHTHTHHTHHTHN